MLLTEIEARRMLARNEFIDHHDEDFPGMRVNRNACCLLCGTQMDSKGPLTCLPTHCRSSERAGRNAIRRWKGASVLIRRTGQFEDRDILIAEAALTAYRASGAAVPSDLSAFLELGNETESTVDEDNGYRMLTEDPDMLARDIS